MELRSDPASGTESKVYRNGILLAPEEDYELAGRTLTFVRQVRTADIIQVEYWIPSAP